MALFFAGLGALWYADYAAIPSAEQRRLLSRLLIPDLMDTQPLEIQRIEVERRAPGPKEGINPGKDKAGEQDQGKG
jgi:hypothetical protein